ncbi:hypothetical protein [Streptomyces sp. SYSU K217416]
MRTALRTAIATAVLAGVALSPATAAFAADAPTTTPIAAAEELISTEKLVDGLTGRVYKIAEGSFRAEILRGEQLLGTLKIDRASGKKYVTGQYGRASVQLFADGTLVTVLTDEGSPQGELISTQDLTHGLTGKVYKTGEGAYAAQILRNVSEEIGRLEITKESGKSYVGGQFDEMYVQLFADGSLLSFFTGGDEGEGNGDDDGEGNPQGKPGPLVPDATPQPTASATTGTATTGTVTTGTGTTGTGTVQTTVVPKGAVAAGAEVAAGGNTTLLVASGAGLASLAAGGLGFAVLRRRVGAGA